MAKPAVLIAAAAPPRPQVLSISSRIASASMVPVKGRPVLGWILNELARQELDRVFVLAPQQDLQVKEYVDRAYQESRLEIETLPEPTAPKGLAHSLYQGLKELRRRGIEVEDLLIVLGHTIFRQDLDFAENWVLYGNVSEEVSRWCYVEVDAKGYVTRFIDKPADHPLPGKALTGLYYLTEADLLFDCLEQAIEHGETIEERHQLSTALALYREKGRELRARPSVDWLDCGSIRGIHRSRRKLISESARAHHSLSVDDELGILTKQSADPVELHHEYSWYASLPQKLQVLAPRVLSYRHSQGGERTELQLEYYGYNSLSEVWVYENLHKDVWTSILQHLLDVVAQFRSYRGMLSLDDFRAVYWNKTEKRLKKLDESATPFPDWSSLLTYSQLFVNGKALSGYRQLKPSIEERIVPLYQPDHVTIIHGDFHLGNILYDVNSRLLKLIDARGSFGSGGIFGDCKYDLAKLRHSLSGGYDLIVNDLFSVKGEKNVWKLQLFSPPQQDRIARFFDDQIRASGFRVEDIQLIEGLLFLSMLPFHYDQPRRQLAMFLRALMILNEVFSPHPTDSEGPFPLPPGARLP